MTECAKCGDCCQDIWIGSSKRRFREIIAYGDPRDDAVWQAWVDSWEPDSDLRLRREAYVRDYLTAAFVVEHWHGGVRAKGKATNHWDCDAFDPLTNLCTAHAERPPVCSDFPWYGKEPSLEPVEKLPNCSFWADLPEETWPEPVRVTLGRTKVA